MPRTNKSSLAAQAIEALLAAKMSVATAESCTAGLVSGALTDIPGASNVFYGGFVTYSNEAKTRMIGVPARLIRDYGAVSSQVARAMADGARNMARSDVAIAVTGIAGPDGGTEKKPVGLVHFACAMSDRTIVAERRFGDIGREEVRAKSIEAALELLIETVKEGVQAP